MDEGECKKAVEFLGRTYRGNQISSRNPSGCYTYYIGYFTGNGYFNKHESGIGNANAKSICTKGVYQSIHDQSLSKIISTEDIFWITN